jgi:hypothetical protein
MRFAAAGVVAVLSALALAAFAGAKGSVGTPAVTILGAAPGSFSAVVSWKVDRLARVVIEYGTAGEEQVWSKPTTGAAGSTRLQVLEPGTEYRFRVIAFAGSSRGVAEGGLRTHPAPASIRARSNRTALVLNGQPFFPRMVYHQCEYAFATSLAAGINTFMGTACGSSRDQLHHLRGRGFSVIPVSTRGVEGAGLIGWHQLDEADEHVERASDLPTLPSSAQTGRVSFLTLTNHFYGGAAPLPKGRAIYPSLVEKAEMIGFDLYPLQIWCRKDRFYDVYESQRELVTLAAGKPTFQWIEAAPMSQCYGLDPSPAIVRAETWLALAGGARGIGYFPDQWTAPVRAEITRINADIASLSAALLGDEGPAATVDPAMVRAGTRIRNGATYVIAVNPTFGRALTKIRLPGLGTQTLRVWRENRWVTAVDGVITDWFRGLAVHIYIAPPPTLG